VNATVRRRLERQDRRAEAAWDVRLRGVPAAASSLGPILNELYAGETHVLEGIRRIDVILDALLEACWAAPRQ
jgi:hypothetical protein